MLTKADSIIQNIIPDAQSSRRKPVRSSRGVTRREKIQRNYKAEAADAQRSLFDGMLELRDQRLALTDNIVQIAQALIFCGMPYRATSEREVTRKSRAADGTIITVVFKALIQDVPLPPLSLLAAATTPALPSPSAGVISGPST
jgi:glycerol-3-phosphate dehydrogenase